MKKFIATGNFGFSSASETALVGGNWNNSFHVGSFYVNLNNPVSNTNTNIGAALSL